MDVKKDAFQAGAYFIIALLVLSTWLESRWVGKPRRILTKRAFYISALINVSMIAWIGYIAASVS